MPFKQLIEAMTQAAVRGDGRAVAECFTEDGVYHDVFYGSFKGSQIADLIDNYFHRDATDFIWDLYDPVETDGVGYVRYVFSYASKLEGKEGVRAGFEGVSICKIREGRIAEYKEVALAACSLHMLGMEDQKVARFVSKEAQEFCGRNETAHHFVKS